MAVGLGIAMLVIFQNHYAAATITVEAGQKLASTGLYTLFRHPMYAGNVIMMVGIPLTLAALCLVSHPMWPNNAIPSWTVRGAAPERSDTP